MWHAQTDEKIAWAMSKWVLAQRTSKCAARHNESDPTYRFQHCLQLISAATKQWRWGARSHVPATPHDLNMDAREMTTGLQHKPFEPVKTPTAQAFRACQNTGQVHQMLLTASLISTHPCQRFSNLALRLPRGWKSLLCRALATPKKVLTLETSHLLRLPWKTQIHTSSSKNGARAPEPAFAREVPGTGFAWDILRKQKFLELLHCKDHKSSLGDRWWPPWTNTKFKHLTPSLNTLFWEHVLP